MGNLSPKQRKAIEALLTEPTVKAAAARAGVNERTLRRYLTDKEFQAAYQEARRESMRRVTARLQQAAGSAVNTLAAIHADPNLPASARVSAARIILDTAYKGVELEDLEERLGRLEEALAG